jgi:tripartite-type tricarboxylate transporter receptor subunit TctC
MNMTLKQLRRVGAVSIALAVPISHPAMAQQEYPVKPIRIVLGSSPGATPDILARMIGNKMSENWRQPVVIENRVGASGMIAASLVAKSTPDGYTLLATAPSFAIRAALVPNLPFDTLKDFAGVAEIGASNTALFVGQAIGVKSIKELIALAQSQPGKVLFASGGAGTADHINGERFRLAAGIKVQHVGFKGQTEALIEVITGRIHYTAASLTSAMPFVKDGKLLVLAVAQRTPLFPDVPAMGEAVKGWGRNGSQSIMAPGGTPLAIRQKISKEIARIVRLPDISSRLESVSFNIAPTTPEETERNLRADIAAFTKVVKDAGLRPN